MRNRVIVLMAFLVFCLAGGTAVLAQSGDDFAWRQEKFYIDLGAFLTSVNTHADVDSVVYGRGTSVDFEKDLGLKDNPLTWRLDAGWRITNRQQLVFSWYQINRSASKTLGSDISWGDYTLLAGTGATAKWDSTFYQLYYRFAFVQGAKGEFGGSIGVSYLQQKAELKGYGTLRSQTGTHMYYVSRSNKLDAPVPVIGIFGLYQFTANFSMKGDIDYLKVNISGVDGSYTDARLTFDYYPWQNTGFGFGWLYDKYDVTANKEGWKGGFTYDFNGPVAYISFKF